MNHIPSSFSQSLATSTPNLSGTPRVPPSTPLVYLIAKPDTGLRQFLDARHSLMLSTCEFPSVSPDQPYSRPQLYTPALLSTPGLDHCCSPSPASLLSPLTPQLHLPYKCNRLYHVQNHSWLPRAWRSESSTLLNSSTEKPSGTHVFPMLHT